MNMPRPKPPETLVKPVDFEIQRYRFDPAVIDNIGLPAPLNGIVAIRQWKLERGMILASVVADHRYKSGFIWADELPSPDNRNGIYAYHLLNFGYATSAFSAGKVIGIIELAGRILEHADGIYRAECCRVLLFLVHTSLAARLSRVYGVPCVIADCENEANRKIFTWLSGREGIRILHRNLQLPADLEAERLLSGIESLSDGIQNPLESDEIPESLKDRGGWVSQYASAAKLSCGYGGIAIKNDAIKAKYPGGMEAFTFNHPCIYNDEFTLVKDDTPGAMDAALADMAGNGVPWHDLDIDHRHNRVDSMPATWTLVLSCWQRAGHQCTVTPADKSRPA